METALKCSNSENFRLQASKAASLEIYYSKILSGEFKRGPNSELIENLILESNNENF